MSRSRPWLRTALGVALAATTLATIASVGAQEAPRRAPASSLTVARAPGRFIVTFRTAVDDQEAEAVASKAATSARTEATLLRRLATGAALVSIADDAKSSSFLDFLAGDPAVAFAEPDTIARPFLTTNDPRYPEQWHYFEAAGGIRLPEALDMAANDGADVLVAVLDTGRTSHSDLDANIEGGYDFISDAPTARDGNGRDSNPNDEGDYEAAGQCGGGAPAQNSSWHGTHVAGTVAALLNNSTGGIGVAPAARIVPVRVLGLCGGFTSDIADAIVWSAGGTVAGVPTIVTPAKVINLSLGGGGSCSPSGVYQTAINTAVARGTSVVVAAGNSNANASGFSPASCANVITVAATNRAGGKASYSNFGSVVDLAGPGGDSPPAADGVLSTLNSGATTQAGETYAFYRGTSMAAPHVAGVAALVLGEDPSLTPAQVEARLKNTARVFPSTCNQCGRGIVDAAAALTGATTTTTVATTTTTLPTSTTTTLPSSTTTTTSCGKARPCGSTTTVATTTTTVAPTTTTSTTVASSTTTLCRKPGSC